MNIKAQFSSGIKAEVKTGGGIRAGVQVGGYVKGLDGKSAYQIALENGFEGTEEEWLASLKGEPGQADAEQVEQIVADYLEKNPIEGVTPDQVDQVVQSALQQAKESGEFDGEKGDDGGYYTPYVNSGGILAWTASKAGMPAVSAANVKGKDGYTPIKGKDYFDGEPGKTPIKGTDYYTEADKAEMVAAVIAALPVYGGETA
jgi:hypothetical protein